MFDRGHGRRSLRCYLSALRSTSRQHAGFGEQHTRAPLPTRVMGSVFLPENASILLVLAGMLPASSHPLDLATVLEGFHLSKNCKVNERYNAETEEECVSLQVSDLDQSQERADTPGSSTGSTYCAGVDDPAIYER